jgi:hypothetical protein
MLDVIVLEDICYIVETSTSGAHCFLCKRLGKIEGTGEEHKVRTECSKCQKAFHPNCFTAYHFRKSLREARNTELAQRLDRLDDEFDCNGRRIRKRDIPARGYPSLANLQIFHTPYVPSKKRRGTAEGGLLDDSSVDETERSESSGQSPN